MPTATPCRHLHTDGRQCGSPALRGEPLCFHHATARRPLPLQKLDGTVIPTLPAPDDHLAIQRGIAEVLRLLTEDRLSDRRATTLLRGLALASANLARHHRREEKLAALGLLTPPVTELTEDPQHGPLACPQQACPQQACPEQACPEQACPEQACPEQACPEQAFPEHAFPGQSPSSNHRQPVPTPRLIPAPTGDDLDRYDSALADEIHAKLAESFRQDRHRFEAQKTAELEALFQARYASEPAASAPGLQIAPQSNEEHSPKIENRNAVMGELPFAS